EPPTGPVASRGRRVRSGGGVRSRMLAKGGLGGGGGGAAVAGTGARLFGASLIPTSVLTFNGKVTSRGGRKSRLVLMNANVYREMKPHPTRCFPATPSCGPASAGIRCFKTRTAAGTHSWGYRHTRY